MSSNEVSMIGVPDFNRFRIVATNIVDVTRSASSDTGSIVIGVNINQAVIFVCYVYNTSASPSYVFQCPYISFNTSGADSGKIIKHKSAYYDPSVGTVKFQVNSTTIDPNYGTGETWRFRYYFLGQKSN